MVAGTPLDCNQEILHNLLCKGTWELDVRAQHVFDTSQRPILDTTGTQAHFPMSKAVILALEDPWTMI
jgi:hypothetical protein